MKSFPKISSDGAIEFYTKYGYAHREGGKPAIIEADGASRYYIHNPSHSISLLYKMSWPNGQIWEVGREEFEEYND